MPCSSCSALHGVCHYLRKRKKKKKRYIVRGDNSISSKFLSDDAENYHQFCKMHGLNQLIQSPTSVTCSTSTLFDHIF